MLAHTTSQGSAPQRARAQHTWRCRPSRHTALTPSLSMVHQAEALPRAAGPCPSRHGPGLPPDPRASWAASTQESQGRPGRQVLRPGTWPPLALQRPHTYTVATWQHGAALAADTPPYSTEQTSVPRAWQQ